jgi:tetratricopeptide (TPR) repeat protein
MLSGLTVACGCTSFVSTAHNGEGVQLFQQARYREALVEFQAAIQDDPANADSYYNLAATYHRLGCCERRRDELEQAEFSYNQCLDRDPNHRDCYRSLAVLLAQEGRLSDAVRLLERWADRQPALADPKIELARLHEELGNRAAAKDELVEALKVDPNNPRALAALGKIREETGEPAQALANYQRSLWHDRAQPAVAARIAALEGLPPPMNGPAPPEGPTEMATGPSNPLR